MTTATIEKGLISFESVVIIVSEMIRKGIDQAYPSKVYIGKLKNEAIDEVVIDDDGNVFLKPVNSNEVMLPSFAKLF
ncbi:hypothetical protein PQE75_gp101 [Bacillus phage vB_BcoS-136]|uniref:Uncharacterized protein n=1 Tax=Bacillus phage vB_BcoS-136 TaxID=2419619 RepID=A0A3G3BVF9_9CAUD|nr:hypothetical protein PQE75_gp101 [Bacillus phage vB_BcoS-136]AYP68233.1 hypothetical protein vBBcoS136_00101 [Bacillus phage vB_BcoS-136]